MNSFVRARMSCSLLLAVCFACWIIPICWMGIGGFMLAFATLAFLSTLFEKKGQEAIFNANSPNAAYWCRVAPMLVLVLMLLTWCVKHISNKLFTWHWLAATLLLSCFVYDQSKYDKPPTSPRPRKKRGAEDMV